jgi:hypothetical protein
MKFPAQKAPSPFAVAVTMVLASTFAGFVLFARMPLERQVTVVPDDGFYYLNLGRNYAALGQWTFDGGISHTTGFHLLHAFTCAAIAQLPFARDAHALLNAHAALGYCLTALAGVFTIDTVARSYGPWAPIGAAVVFSGGAALAIPRMAMEWPWVVLLISSYLASISREQYLRASLWAFLLPFARTDAVAWVWAFSVAVALYRIHQRERLRICDCAAALAAALGFALVSTYYHAQSGHWLQGSARIKALWGGGFDPRQALGMLTRTLPPAFMIAERPNTPGRSAPWLAILWVALALSLATLLAAVARPRSRPEASAKIAYVPRAEAGWKTSAAASGLFLATAAMIAIYTRVGGIMPWYCGIFMSATAFALARLTQFLPAAQRSTARPCTSLGLCTIATCTLLASIAASESEIWPHQRAHVAAGHWLATEHLSGPVASTNAGIMGFLSGSRVVNFDGLVNDDLYDDIAGKRDYCYLKRIGAALLIDPVCSDTPLADVTTLGVQPLRGATRLVRDFGASEGEPQCSLRAFALDLTQLPPCP